MTRQAPLTQPCASCGTKDATHAGRGLCPVCYRRAYRLGLFDAPPHKARLGRALRP